MGAVDNYPKVAIIILNWNGLQDTVECLESAYKSDYANYEIIVVDNSSTDNSVNSIRARFPKVILVLNKENVGYAGGNNAGIKRALDNGADYLWLLNNDTVVEKSTLRALVEACERSNAIGLASPVIYDYPDKSRLQFCGAYVEKKTFVNMHLKDLSELAALKESLILWGTGLLVTKSVVERIGYLNKKYFAYLEDFEYSLRALNAGFATAVVPVARIYHKNHYMGETIGIKTPVHQFFYMTRNRWWYWRSMLTTKAENIKYSHYYFARLFSKIAQHKKEGNRIYAEAMLDGAYCAFRNHGGSFNDCLQMPKFIKNLTLLQPRIMSKILSVGLRPCREKSSSCCFPAS